MGGWGGGWVGGGWVGGGWGGVGVRLFAKSARKNLIESY